MTENPDGSCIFKIEVVINVEMYSVFMSDGSGVKIIYLKIAVEYMKAKMQEAARMYEETGLSR